MQCSRCYYTNPTGARTCEYCGANLGGTDTDSKASGGGAASSKRKTMLGPPPASARPAPLPTRPSRIDPADPFRIAAEGIAAASAAPVTNPAPDAEPEAPAPPPPAPTRAEPPRQRPTLIAGHAAPEGAVVGVAMLFPDQAPPRAVLLHEGRNRIGRRAHLEIVIDDPEVSMDHAILRIGDGSGWLLDTSANGTRVSGKLCLNDRADVTDGTVLELGHCAVVIKLLSHDTLSMLDANTP